MYICVYELYIHIYMNCVFSFSLFRSPVRSVALSRSLALFFTFAKNEQNQQQQQKSNPSFYLLCFLALRSFLVFIEEHLRNCNFIFCFFFSRLHSFFHYFLATTIFFILLLCFALHFIEANNGRTENSSVARANSLWNVHNRPSVDNEHSHLPSFSVRFAKSNTLVKCYITSCFFFLFVQISDRSVALFLSPFVRFRFVSFVFLYLLLLIIIIVIIFFYSRKQL